MTNQHDSDPEENGNYHESASPEQFAPDDDSADAMAQGVRSSDAEHASHEDDARDRAGYSPGAFFFGAVVTLGFIAFVLLARVTVHPVDKIDRRMRVLDVWSRLRNNLPEVAHPELLRVIFDVSIIVIVLGSLACVWIALLAAGPNEKNDQSLPPPAASSTLQSEH